ncbi:ankyrin repeat-containing domain protein, partial [Flagelloscypha sp. PMI_526]
LCSLFADFWEHQTQCTSSSSPSHPLWPNLEFYSHRDALQHTALSSLETIFAAICWLGEVSTNPSVKLAAAQSLPGLLPTLSLPDPHGDLSTERWMALDEVQRKRIVRALLPLYSTVWSILRDTIWHVYPNFPEVIDPNSREYNVWIRAEVLARSLIYHFGDETDFKAVAQHRTTAFVKSIQGRSPELFRFLIDYGLVIALPHSNTLEQRRWIRHRDIDVCVPLEGAAGDFTALHSLAESDSNIQMLQSLIPFRPNFNVFSGVSRKTPLHVASASGSIQVVQWLCAQRADPYLVDANGFTPFVLAIHRGHFDIAEYIFQHHSMSAANSPVPIPHSITSEHNLFGHRRHWSQALLIACQDGCVPVVQTLLSEGVNPNDWDFISPLHKACASGHLEIVELLHDHGFDFTAGSPVNSPLFDACGLGHIRIVKRLLDFGVDVNLQAIDAGSERESSDVPPGQSNSSAVNSAKDNDSTWAYKAGVADGRTALHLACANGDVEMVRLLFNYSADPTLLDSQQRLALDVAREFSHWDIVKMFP